MKFRLTYIRNCNKNLGQSLSSPGLEITQRIVGVWVRVMFVVISLVVGFLTYSLGHTLPVGMTFSLRTVACWICWAWDYWTWAWPHTHKEFSAYITVSTVCPLIFKTFVRFIFREKRLFFFFSFQKICSVYIPMKKDLFG